MSETLLPCPRCGQPVFDQTYYGPCSECRSSLRTPVKVVTEPHVKVSKNAQPTSREAAKVHLLKSGTARHKVLSAIAQKARTDEELQTELDMSPNTQRPRRGECCDAGWVQDSGARRPTATGLPSIVWEITDTGTTALGGTQNGTLDP